MKDIIVIGIAGGTSSGKSTLIRRIKDEFENQVTILSHDSYYKRHDEMSYDERCKLNYDHPDAFDTQLMVYHLLELVNGNTVEIPVYDFTIHNRVDDTETLHPTSVVIVEGILIFENKQLRDMCDIKVFVDTDDDIRILRRIMRDVKERGRTIESVVEQYLTTVKPMHEQFVEPSKKFADIIVPEGGHNTVALEMINERIYALLRERNK